MRTANGHDDDHDGGGLPPTGEVEGSTYSPRRHQSTRHSSKRAVSADYGEAKRFISEMDREVATHAFHPRQSIPWSDSSSSNLFRDTTHAVAHGHGGKSLAVDHGHGAQSHGSKLTRVNEDTHVRGRSMSKTMRVTARQVPVPTESVERQSDQIGNSRESKAQRVFEQFVC